jgi:hypothetical protein
MTKLIVAFRNFANAPNSYSCSYVNTGIRTCVTLKVWRHTFQTKNVPAILPRWKMSSGTRRIEDCVGCTTDLYWRLRETFLLCGELNRNRVLSRGPGFETRQLYLLCWVRILVSPCHSFQTVFGYYRQIYQDAILNFLPPELFFF